MHAFERVLVVAAHPDDEMLGCGGALARLRSRDIPVSILLLGEGPTSRTGSNNSVRNEATSSAIAAAASLGITDVRFGGLPDNKFDSIPLLDIVWVIEKIARETQPDLVFTHHAGDLNIDHTLSNKAVMTAFRPLPDSRPTSILGFEVLSSTEYNPPHLGPSFHPNVFINIEDHLEAKQKALAAYASEMRPWPHPRSHEGVEHLARLRGCQCGHTAAEAFILFRSVF